MTRSILHHRRKALIDIAAASAQDELLAILADSTGGVFFHNSNDLDEGLRRVARRPNIPTCWHLFRKI